MAVMDSAYARQQRAIHAAIGAKKFAPTHGRNPYPVRHGPPGVPLSPSRKAGKAPHAGSLNIRRQIMRFVPIPHIHRGLIRVTRSLIKTGGLGFAMHKSTNFGKRKT